MRRPWIALAAAALLAGCAPRGPAWPAPTPDETDGGESLAPRPAAVANVEASTRGEAAAASETPAVTEPTKPAATAPPAAEPAPAATPAATDEVITTEEIVIEIEE